MYSQIIMPSAEILERIRREFTYDPETGVIMRTTRRGTRQIKHLTMVGDYRTSTHRIAWFFISGEWPDKIIDHIDRNHFNNRANNLQLATVQQNVANSGKYKPATSKYKGVQKQGHRWIAQCQKTYYGPFDDEIEAAKAYDTAAISAFGDRACCNFIGAHPLFPAEEKPSISTPYTPITVEQRFLQKVNKNGPTMEHMDTPCWMWAAGIANTGYGTFQMEDDNIIERLAHRASYMLFCGPIAEGLCVCHKCDNRACVRPDHLWLGTDKDNSDDKIRKGRDRHAQGEDAANASLTNAQVIEVRKRYAVGNTTYPRLAVEYGVQPSTIQNAVIGTQWAQIAPELIAPKERDHQARGERVGGAVLTDAQAIEIRKAYWVRDKKPTYVELSKTYNFRKGVIRNLIQRKTWSHLPLVEGETGEASGKALGTDNGKSKLNDEKVYAARVKHKAGIGYATLAKEYNVGYTCIRNAIIGITWSHVPFP